MPDQLTEATAESAYAQLSTDMLFALRRVFLSNFETWTVSRDRVRVVERILEARGERVDRPVERRRSRQK